MNITAEQRIKNIFRQTCIAVSKLGMSPTVLSDKKSWECDSLDDYANKIYEQIHMHGAGNELQTSILSDVARPGLRDCLVSTFSLLAWSNVSSKDVISNYAALGLVAAKLGIVITFDEHVPDMNVIRTYA